MKYLLFSFVSVILGVAIGFYVCKQTYQPQVTELKEIITAKDAEVVKLKEDVKNNVRLVFAHNENCKVEDTIQ